MTLVKRLVKGTALTHQEMDGNWDHVTDPDRVKFLTSNVDQGVDVSDPGNYCVLRTGSSWTGTRTITLNGTPPSRGRMMFSNNSGQTINIANGTGSPFDFPTLPMALPDDQWVELVVLPSTSKLIRVAKGST